MVTDQLKNNWNSTFHEQIKRKKMQSGKESTRWGEQHRNEREWKRYEEEEIVPKEPLS